MNQDMANRISELFNLPPLQFAGKAKGGFLSDNYILKSEKQKYFLKCYRPSAHDRLPVIAKAEDFFANNNLPIILPLKTKNKKTYFKINNNIYSLYPFVSGEIISHRKGGVTSHSAKAMGTNLALMHVCSKRKIPSIPNKPLAEWDPKHVLSAKSRKNFYHYAEKVTALLEAKPKKTAFDTRVSSMIKLKLSIVNSVPKEIHVSALGKGHVVHGDYHPQNLFFNQKDGITHIFDLEKSDIRPRSLELVRSMFIICFNGHFNPKHFKLAKTYLKAYNEVYPIKNSEIENAIRFMYYKHILNLWMEKEHYLNHNTRPDPLVKGELNFLKYLSKNTEQLIQKLLYNK